MTRKEVDELQKNQEVHFARCVKLIGPRGGVKLQRSRSRVSGKLKTWKRRPEDFRLPIRSGLYKGGYITPENMVLYHKASTCTPVEVRTKQRESKEKAK